MASKTVLSCRTITAILAVYIVYCSYIILHYTDSVFKPHIYSGSLGIIIVIFLLLCRINAFHAKQFSSLNSAIRPTYQAQFFYYAPIFYYCICIQHIKQTTDLVLAANPIQLKCHSLRKARIITLFVISRNNLVYQPNQLIASDSINYWTRTILNRNSKISNI